MTSHAGHKANETPSSDDTDNSSQYDTSSKQPCVEITTNASTSDTAKSSSDNNKLNMEEAIETSSEETPTATSRPIDVGSSSERLGKGDDDLSEDVADCGQEKASDSLRPRTDSNLSKASSEVNWEELQKTENRHVEEEGSDEVFNHN